MHYLHQFLGICYFLLTLLLGATIVMFTQEISWAGFWTDRIIIWLWLGLSIYMLIHHWRLLTTKVLFSVGLAIIGLSLVPMGIPFIATVAYVSGANLENRMDVDVRYELRVETAIMGTPTVYLVENQGYWERSVARDHFSDIAYQAFGEEWEYDYNAWKNFSVRLVAENKDSILLEYQTPTKAGVFAHARIPQPR